MKVFPSLKDRQFVCFIHSNGLAHINLGISIDFWSPNIELHLPFCFIRIGWQGVYRVRSPHWSFGKKYR